MIKPERNVRKCFLEVRTAVTSVGSKAVLEGDSGVAGKVLFPRVSSLQQFTELRTCVVFSTFYFTIKTTMVFHKTKTIST